MSRFLIVILFLCQGLACGQEAKFQKKNGFLSIPDKIHAYFFSGKGSRLVVRDETDLSHPRYGSLDEAMRKSPCRAGVNGGYFGPDSEGTPLGMVVQDGKQINPLQTGSFAVSGIVYDTGKEIVLMRSKAYVLLKPRPKPFSALQGGPFLLENGKPVSGLNDQRSAMRTFIATDGKGCWCLATTSRMTLHDLALWLAEPKSMGGFTPKTVLNLDGGTSSAFWSLEKATYFPSIKQVRNYIGVAER